MRKKADYEVGDQIQPLELKKHFELANQLLTYVDRLPVGRSTT